MLRGNKFICFLVGAVLGWVSAAVLALSLFFLEREARLGPSGTIVNWQELLAAGLAQRQGVSVASLVDDARITQICTFMPYDDWRVVTYQPLLVELFRRDIFPSNESEFIIFLGTDTLENDGSIIAIDRMGRDISRPIDSRRTAQFSSRCAPLVDVFVSIVQGTDSPRLSFSIK